MQLARKKSLKLCTYHQHLKGILKAQRGLFRAQLYLKIFIVTEDGMKSLLMLFAANTTQAGLGNPLG